MSGNILIDTIDLDLDEFTASDSHGLITGDAVKLSADTAPIGIVNGSIYYIRVIDATTFSIYLTAADANNDINRVDITSQGVDVTFTLVSVPKVEIYESSKIVNHPGVEPVATIFSDYSRELIFVEGVNTDYGRVDVLHTTANKSVFGKGITTSPTYIFTDSAPKAAPGPPEINEVWIVS
jgi:hypothetical protein